METTIDVLVTTGAVYICASSQTAGPTMTSNVADIETSRTTEEETAINQRFFHLKG